MCVLPLLFPKSFISSYTPGALTILLYSVKKATGILALARGTIYAEVEDGDTIYTTRKIGGEDDVKNATISFWGSNGEYPIT